MEEIMSMVFNGINLVKELEFSLSSSQESPESMLNSLGSISNLFGEANEQLKMLLARRNSFVPNLPQLKPVPMSGFDQMMMQIDSGLVQDSWLTHAAMQTVESTDSGASSQSSTPRHRRRKKDEAEVTVLVAAARMGNIEIPPDDNYIWRKYGQKEILGSKFPRAYYRCTHQKLYKCPAKKQVQRLDEDPYTFRVTYRSSHTCHFFTTSPIASASAVTTATTSNFHYGPQVTNMAGAMLSNMDSVVPLGEHYF